MPNKVLFLKQPAGGTWERFGGTVFFQLRCLWFGKSTAAGNVLLVGGSWSIGGAGVQPPSS